MLDYLSCGCPDLSYHGEEAWKLNTDRQSRIAGVMYCGRYAKKNRQENDESFYIAYNMHWEAHNFALPALPEGQRWIRVCDTFEEEPKEGGARELPEEEGKETYVPGRSIRILMSSPAGRTEVPEGKQTAGKRRKRKTGVLKPESLPDAGKPQQLRKAGLTDSEE